MTRRTSWHYSKNMIPQLNSNQGHFSALTSFLGMIADVDLNGNGKVEFEEFLVMMSRKTKRLDDGDGVDIAFQIFDADKDGLISSEELK